MEIEVTWPKIIEQWFSTQVATWVAYLFAIVIAEVCLFSARVIWGREVYGTYSVVGNWFTCFSIFPMIVFTPPNSSFRSRFIDWFLSSPSIVLTFRHITLSIGLNSSYLCPTRVAYSSKFSAMHTFSTLVVEKFGGIFSLVIFPLASLSIEDSSSDLKLSELDPEPVLDSSNLEDSFPSSSFSFPYSCTLTTGVALPYESAIVPCSVDLRPSLSSRALCSRYSSSPLDAF